ncbi:MAG: DUF2807 domain-containing protein [Tatlockia sp.]
MQMESAQNHPFEQTRPVGLFNRIAVKGKINVSLHTGAKNARLVLHGDPRDLQHVSSRVVNNILRIRVAGGYPRYGEISTEIFSQYLNGFDYTGAGTITGNRIHSGLLDLGINNPGQTKLAGSMVLRKLSAAGGGNIELHGVRTRLLLLKIEGKTKVQLAGVISLSRLDLNGDGLLSMYWVKSDRLEICSRGHTFIQLGGVVDRLDVELWDSAHFNGRFLRAKSAFIKTHGKSIADITVLKHQHTLALDTSNIYFYKIPQTKADFMAFDGAVLDMRDWNRFDLRDYDRYNSRSSAGRSNLVKRPLSTMELDNL